MEAVRSAIAKAAERDGLSEEEAEAAFTEILEGKASEPEIAGLLVGLRAKGETLEEIVGAAKALRKACVRFAGDGSRALDTCGTGGDGAGTLNLSSLAALAAAAAGAKVAKHGNRSFGGPCGSADLYESLGVKIDCPPEAAARCLEKAGVCFLFAPLYHPAMKHAGPVRKALGIRTIFNLVGPLANPAGVKRQLIGVPQKTLAGLFSQAMRRLGLERGLVVTGADGLDEATLAGPSFLVWFDRDREGEAILDPTGLGMKVCMPQDLKVNSREEAVSAAKKVLEGSPGPRLEATALNAALALSLLEPWPEGPIPAVKQGLEKAREALLSRKAEQTLKQLAEESHK